MLSGTVSHKPTAFQARVYAAVRRIPRGRVTTYKLLAQYLGCRSWRAVGQALKHNPYAFTRLADVRRQGLVPVPCHRVIATDGTLGGFEGRRGGAALKRKRALLAAEGVRFQQGRLVDPAGLYSFTV